jgi:hypothetical protein
MARIQVSMISVATYLTCVGYLTRISVQHATLMPKEKALSDFWQCQFVVRYVGVVA